MIDKGTKLVADKEKNPVCSQFKVAYIQLKVVRFYFQKHQFQQTIIYN